ncbi:MBL fold hydrolase [Agromyces humatus]|uniref:MBL fold hydrolase n=2 Tax=Agromyces humatus TaxID=279573 RepID=A0ABN2KD70_9MICO
MVRFWQARGTAPGNGLRRVAARVLARGMRLTKLEHAALVIEDSGDLLFIDPGKFTTPITESAGAAAVVITHQHDDHWTPDQLRRILEANTAVRIFGPAGVAAAASDFDVEVVDAGDEVEAGPFRLRFFGGKHAVIHRSIPVIDNVGVLVNDALYYGGDSFALPEGVAVEVLAAPAAAPWMKISEAMDYVEAVAPRRAFPTHEMLLSQAGKALSNTRLAWATEQGGGEYLPLEPGDTIDF